MMALAGPRLHFSFFSLIILVSLDSTQAASDYVEPSHLLLREHLKAIEELNLPELIELALEINTSDDDDNAFVGETSVGLGKGFSTEDELQLIDDIIDQAEQEILNSPDAKEEADFMERDLRSLASSNKQQSKRFTVDFNGMQVSYPTYVRLTRLQDKVLKLQRTIQALHRRYTEEQLAHLPQYQRLMSLYNSLRPLLPTKDGGEEAASSTSAAELQESKKKKKRSPFTVEFMGMRVTYPQYLRLVSLQEKVIKLDMIMRRMRAKVSLEQLEQVPKWHTLVSLHEALKKMLPPDYLAQYADAGATKMGSGGGEEVLARRKKRSAKFNDIYVSIPDYGRLMGMQRSALKLDQIMRKMMREMDKEKLFSSPKWRQLVDLRKSLQKLMPEGHPEFLDGDESMDKIASVDKRAVTMEFNGVRVSYPEYVRLVGLQKKVQKLDAVMERIRQLKGDQGLETLPQWLKLVELRKALVRLQPLASAN